MQVIVIDHGGHKVDVILDDGYTYLNPLLEKFANLDYKNSIYFPLLKGSLSEAVLTCKLTYKHCSIVGELSFACSKAGMKMMYVADVYKGKDLNITLRSIGKLDKKAYPAVSLQGRSYDHAVTELVNSFRVGAPFRKIGPI